MVGIVLAEQKLDCFFDLISRVAKLVMILVSFVLHVFAVETVHGTLVFLEGRVRYSGIWRLLF